jgi:hypothetical protein
MTNVPPTLSEVRSGGKLCARHGTDYVEVDGNRACEFLEFQRCHHAPNCGDTTRGCRCTSRRLTRSAPAVPLYARRDGEVCEWLGYLALDELEFDRPLAHTDVFYHELKISQQTHEGVYNYLCVQSS